MYLSRLILNPRHRAVRRDLADCHQLHRTVMAAFPDLPGEGGARAELGVLYRLDAGEHGQRLSLLVQSRVEPDWSRLPSGYLREAEAGVSNPACKPIDAAYAGLGPDGEFVFRLRANPTRRVHDRRHPDDALKGKRVALLEEDDQLDWLWRKGEQGGFALLTVRVRPEGDARQQEVFGAPRASTRSVPDTRATPGTDVVGFKAGRRQGDERRARMTFGSVLFEGRLRITDAELFRETLARGIGPGKAYGFGLLSLAPGRAWR